MIKGAAPCITRHRALLRVEGQKRRSSGVLADLAQSHWPSSLPDLLVFSWFVVAGLRHISCLKTWLAKECFEVSPGKGHTVHGSYEADGPNEGVVVTLVSSSHKELRVGAWGGRGCLVPGALCVRVRCMCMQPIRFGTDKERLFALTLVLQYESEVPSTVGRTSLLSAGTRLCESSLQGASPRA